MAGVPRLRQRLLTETRTLAKGSGALGATGASRAARDVAEEKGDCDDASVECTMANMSSSLTSSPMAITKSE